ncbi:class I SAM-dependent methyltransferase [Nocardioides sp. NPDC101246]|uniref:class I SAM-dependent methyltransferase n=1 Tax=Nocardioides sp. NPDC101246 TaxID=3364336 RepID=UPI00382D2B37
MGSFREVEIVWSERLGSLRNVVRQQVIHRQLTNHTNTASTALDVGCGQGTQAIELAARGVEVTGIDPSRDLLETLAATAKERGVTVETLQGTLEDLDRLVGATKYDLVTAHGLMMYLDDPEAAVSALAARVAGGGTLSITFRNGAALAYRPGLRRQWQRALASFDATTYVNELGAEARAHTLEEMTAWCEASGLQVERWYGVRVLTDGVPADEIPDQHTLADCIAAELEAGSRDPYRHLGSQLHVIARAR